MLLIKAYAAASATSVLAPYPIRRREPGPHDVLIDILYCGICHSDIHVSRGLFSIGFPTVPGHEIVGKVAATGDAVTQYRVGELVAVGCFVDSCRSCPECQAGEEQFCDGVTLNMIGLDKDGKTPIHGGYSAQTVVDENYVLRLPANLDPAATAPLLCAGITTYSPLRHWGVGKGSRVGVIGLGGLGHLAVKFAVAMGAEVTVLSTSSRKQVDALQLGASDFAVTTEAESFKRLAGQFDLILNTVSADISYDHYLSLLKRDGTLVLLGIPENPVSLNAFGLMMRRKSVSASNAGGIRETREMLEFCSQHGIVSDIEIIAIDQVNEAYERVLKSDVRYRFVIDMTSLG